MATNPVKKHFSFTIKDFYKIFKDDKKASGKSCKNIIPYKVYKGIIEDFFEAVMKLVIYDNFTFRMPYSLGIIMIKAYKTNLKKASIDYNQTKKTGKVVRFLNQHTYGYYFGFIWDKSYSRFKNHSLYKFKATKSDHATRLGIGKISLSRHIKKLSLDPKQKSYTRI